MQRMWRYTCFRQRWRTKLLANLSNQDHIVEVNHGMNLRKLPRPDLSSFFENADMCARFWDTHIGTGITELRMPCERSNYVTSLPCRLCVSNLSNCINTKYTSLVGMRNRIAATFGAFQFRPLCPCVVNAAPSPYLLLIWPLKVHDVHCWLCALQVLAGGVIYLRSTKTHRPASTCPFMPPFDSPTGSCWLGTQVSRLKMLWKLFVSSHSDEVLTQNRCSLQVVTFGSRYLASTALRWVPPSWTHWSPSCCST